jgi:hypothetical protein
MEANFNPLIMAAAILLQPGVRVNRGVVAIAVSTIAKVDRYIVETLMRDLVGHDGRSAAFVLYLYLATRPTRKVSASLADLARGTGLSKRSIQLNVACLQRRGLLDVSRTSRTAVPTYATLRPWR